MADRPPRKNVTVRLVRRDEDEPLEESWLGRSVEERIEGVWELTKLCLTWQGSVDEPRLQRATVRVLRPGR